MGIDGKSRPGVIGWLPTVSAPALRTPPVSGRFGSAAAGSIEPRASPRRPYPCRLVADPDEEPHEQEGGIQRPVGLRQRVDRQVVLVGAESRPSTSQASATPIRISHGATPRRARRLPPRPGRGHGSLTGSRCQPRAPPLLPRLRASPTATTAPSEISQVISAGPVARWKPLTQPHHAQSATPPTVRATRRPRTALVYPRPGDGGSAPSIVSDARRASGTRVGSRPTLDTAVANRWASHRAATTVVVEVDEDAVARLPQIAQTARPAEERSASVAGCRCGPPLVEADIPPRGRPPDRRPTAMGVAQTKRGRRSPQRSKVASLCQDSCRGSNATRTCFGNASSVACSASRSDRRSGGSCSSTGPSSAPSPRGAAGAGPARSDL